MEEYKKNTFEKISFFIIIEIKIIPVSTQNLQLLPVTYKTITLTVQ